jgi:two-component system, OmpR family, response regulator
MRYSEGVGSANILLVEDENNVAFVASAALRLADYSVTEAASGQDGLVIASRQPIDLAILDVMLPDIDGFEMCQKLRAAGYDFPIVFLTARDATEDRVRGLTIGGDDYLTKPFSVEELVARVQVILRRVGKQPPGRTYRCGSISLNDASHIVFRDGRQIDLSPTEYKLLRFLLRNTGRVLNRDQILDHVWDYDFVGETNVVDTYIHTLRKKVDQGEPRLIQTVRGLGYRMTAP